MYLKYESNGALKPCPFCGGEAEYHSHVSGQGINTGRVVCTKCKAAIPDSLYGPGVSEPCEHWNTRYENTCHITWHSETFSFVCDACDIITMMPPGENPKYCPNCGAKAVDE